MVSSDLYERINNRAGAKLRVESSGKRRQHPGDNRFGSRNAFAGQGLLNTSTPSSTAGTNRVNTAQPTVLPTPGGQWPLNAVLSPNIVPDTAVNVKFLEQELLTVNSALGVIKKGQRIVDRGEIVTPQIFTNLKHIPRHARYEQQHRA